MCKLDVLPVAAETIIELRQGLPADQFESV
jgi:hypothetical protein